MNLPVAKVGYVLGRRVPTGLFTEVAWEVAVPDLPVVHVALTAVVVVFAPERAPRPVRGAPVEPGDDAGQHLVVVERARDGGVLA
jgi:hypothetical protein